MDEFLNSLYSSSSVPALSALLLGLMTAISPCPMATNITAIGFISKDIENQNTVFYNGLIYTLGRVLAYSTLAIIIVLGPGKLGLKGWFEEYGSKILGPILILIGIIMLGILKINFPGFNKLSKRFEKKSKFKSWDVLLIGILFALAFCPYSGVLYFGLLIPLTIKTTSGLYLPVIFAIATAIPVIIFAWLLAYMVSGVGKFYNRLKQFDFWFRKVIAMLFIGVGVYYSYYTIVALFK
jgi:cytochrome c-type biogenesis protein